MAPFLPAMTGLIGFFDCVTLAGGTAFISTAMLTGATSWATEDIYRPNWLAAGIAGGLAGLSAGIEGGIRAKSLGLDFWTGNGKIITEMKDSFVVSTDFGEKTNITNNKELTEYTFKNFEGSDEYVLYVYKGKEGPFKSYKVDESGQLFNSEGERINGVTLSVKYGFLSRLKSLINISPNMITYTNNLNAVLGHEVIHAFHAYTGFTALYGLELSDYYAYMYSCSINHATIDAAQIQFNYYSQFAGRPFSLSSVYPKWVNLSSFY